MAGAGSIGWERGDDGVVVLTLDDPARAVNTMDAAFRADLRAVTDRLEAERDGIAGVVVASAKQTFFAGGDLDALVAIGPDEAAAAAEMVEGVKADLRRIETLGKPVVAAIGGAALGGGLEIALACHHRVVVDDPRAVVGFPEVTLGLMPGAGGVVRTVRMLGIVPALANVLMEGRSLRPARALELGLVDEVVAAREELVPAAKAWIAANPEATQPWDRDGYAIPGGRMTGAELEAVMPTLPAVLSKQLRGAPYPAPHAIQAAAAEGAQVDFDSASTVEGRYFVDLVTGQAAKNMIQAFFFDMNAVRGRGSDGEPWAPAKAVVLGAGMMGAGIAYVCAKAGIEVVLQDVSAEAAERGRGHSRKLVAKAVERGRMSQADADALVGRIRATADPADAAGAELVIEAVFEDPKVKAEVFAAIEPHLADGALLGSNTSSLPITGLAEGVSRPEDFVGLHFFSPVDRMPLLEIVKGERTSDAALARALDLAKAIAKTPIVVNDSRGFFTTRVIGAFIDEGIALLGEGAPAPSIEQASGQAGYPAPVLQLADELNLALLRKVGQENRAAAEAEGRAAADNPASAVIETMIDGHGRAGRAAGAGFYDYADGRRTGLWGGLRDAFGGQNRDIPFADLVERMLFVEAIEAAKCFEEGVIESVADANVGSILGIGFPGWTGGVLQYVNGYAGGPAGFVARARELAGRYGDRFEPPASLVELAAAGGAYEEE